MALDSQDSNISSLVLDASEITYDRVFEEIIKAISPKTIVSTNQSVIEAFVDILSEISPISVNMLDVYSKDTSITNIENVQLGFAKMYLNNFYSVWRQAETDYILRNRLENLLQKYRDLDSEELLEDISFFDDENSMYTAERYTLGKDFKEKKGTATAIEYAYKVGWLAGIEGPLRTEYDFNLIQEECIGGVSQGFWICDSLVTPCSGLDGSGTSKLINSFIISEEVTGELCTPFTYQIEGSMLPELFEAFVVPLAHPVGFRYIYTKVLKLALVDYFNIEYVYSADKVNIYSLCPLGDCSKVSTTLMASKDSLGVSKSYLKYIEEGKIYLGLFKDYTFKKYIFANGDYVIEYVLSSAGVVAERVIHYYDASLIEDGNIILNSIFNSNLYWNIPDNSAWHIDTDLGVGVLDSGLIGDYISQPIALEVGVEYLISVDVSNIAGKAQLSLGQWQTYDESGVLIPGVYDTQIYELESNLTYSFYYTARGGEHFRISASEDNSSVMIDNILVTKNQPALEFPAETHSSIELVNLSLPVPILYTYDAIESFDMYTSTTENMNDLYFLNSGDLTPYIGSIVVNNFYYGESTYLTTGEEQIVIIGRSNTVNYTILGLGSGNIGTIYKAVYDLGSIDINTEDFLNTLRWSVFVLNNSAGDPDDDITNEGGFIIGNYVLPWGSPDTAYMYDTFSADVIGVPWVENYVNQDFIDPTKWTVGSSWSIITNTSPELNKASKLATIETTEEQRTIYRYYDLVPDIGHYVKVTVHIEVSPEDINLTDTWIDVVIGDNAAHRYYDSGTKEVMLQYNGNNKIKFIASDNFEGSINNITSISCSINSVYDGNIDLYDGNIIYADGN